MVLIIEILITSAKSFNEVNFNKKVRSYGYGKYKCRR